MYSEMLDEMTFEQVAKIATKLSSPPNNEEKGLLYGLYKQTLMGDIDIEQPAFYQFEAKAKWNAWKKQEGKSKEEAEGEYRKLVVSLCQKYGKNK